MYIYLYLRGADLLLWGGSAFCFFETRDAAVKLLHCLRDTAKRPYKFTKRRRFATLVRIVLLAAQCDAHLRRQAHVHLHIIYSYIMYTHTWYIYTYVCIPPRDGEGLRDFYHDWTNSILQQLKRKFWKIADALFRISWISHSFTYTPGVSTTGVYHPYSFVPDPQISWNCEASNSWP